MPESKEGGCLCGSVRFRAVGEPLRAHACHCKFCQRRTGSAFAEVAYYPEEDIDITGGALTAYTHRSDVSGRWLRMEFCPVCGTCITIALERRPGELGIHIGTLDDPSSLKLRRHIWTTSEQGTTLIPDYAERRMLGLNESDLDQSTRKGAARGG